MKKILLISMLLAYILVTVVSCNDRITVKQTLPDTAILETSYQSSECVEDNIKKEIELVRLNLTEFSSDLPGDFADYPVYEEMFSLDYAAKIWSKIEEGVYPNDFIMSFSDIPTLKFKIKWSDDKIVSIHGHYVITDIYCFNKGIHLSEPLAFNEVALSINITSEIIIIGNISYDEQLGWYNTTAHWYLLTSCGFYYMENMPCEDRYECRFYSDQDKIIFKKTNSDYLIAIQAICYMMEVYTDENQFFYESGVLVIKNNEISFNYLKYVTVNDWYLSDEFIMKDLRDKYNVDTISEFYRILKENGY